MRRTALQALAAHGAADGLSASTSHAPVSYALDLCRQALAGPSSWVLSRSISASSAPHEDQQGGNHGGQRQSGGFKQRRGDRQDGDGPRRGNDGDSSRQRPQQQGGQQRRGTIGGRDGGHSQQARGPQGRGQDGAGPSDRSRANTSPQGGGAAAQAALQPQAQPQPDRWDLVASNAPKRVFELIGDPRSGVADDTTTNPFGEVTVDMVHYQTSNEVYWFKYEFAGGQMRGSHRDARLSDYSRNLIYLLRAKDPKRWTIQALADKFRIRKQRVLAILALKELEAQRMEDGKLLGGPLSGYALSVSTDDVHLDPASGMPLDLGALGRAPPAGTPAGAAMAAAAQLHVSKVLPTVLSATQGLQSQLLDVLRAHRFDAERLRADLLAELAAAEAAAAKLLGGEGAEGEGAGAEYLKAEMEAYRAAIERVATAVGQVVERSPLLQEERKAAALQDAVRTALATAGGAVGKEIGALPLAAAPPAAPADGGAGAADAAAARLAPSEGLSALQQQLSAALEPVMQNADDAALQRLFFSLDPPTRGSLLRLLPDLSIRLNAAGVDLGRAAKDGAYRGPAAAVAAAEAEAAAAAAGGAGGSGSQSQPKLEVDVFGFVQVPERELEALAAAVGGLVGAQAAVVAKLEALDPALAAAQPVPEPVPALSAEHLRRVRSLVRSYLATESMWGDLKAPGAGEGKEAGFRQGNTGLADLRRNLEILAETDPDAIRRALLVEAAMINRRRRDFLGADAIAAGAGAEAAAAEAAAKAAEAAAATGDAAEAGGEEGALAAAAAAAARPGDRASWDAIAAYLDAKVAGRVFPTGSGERHVTRLPTYPAFEGYSLEDFDRAREGELSSLNRQVADKMDEQMYERFRSDLLYNLGVRGEKLRDSPPGQAPWPTNLRTELTRPVVVYGIGPDGSTQYPPLYVANGGGSRRPLNDNEKVFQERRLPRPRLPYIIGRARRLPELE